MDITYSAVLVESCDYLQGTLNSIEITENEKVCDILFTVDICNSVLPMINLHR